MSDNDKRGKIRVITDEQVSALITGGLVPRGAYDDATDYVVGDSVSYLGSSYVMFVDAAAGTLPTDTTKWQVLANKGATGSTGSAGADGASAFVYIAYASADDGTGFTMTFDAALNYVAILETNTAIPAPAASDFTGLWKNYKGATGAQGPAGTSGHTIEEEGTPLTARTKLNFVGAGVTATDDAGNDQTIVTISAGSGDVIAPATNTDAYIPQWNGANSKTLKDGLAVPAGGLAGLTALGGKSSLALDNLASVAINTSLISDTNSTDDLGSSSKYWANTYTDSLHLTAGTTTVAPIMMVAGTNLTNPVAGVIEFDGTDLWISV